MPAAALEGYVAQRDKERAPLVPLGLRWGGCVHQTAEGVFQGVCGARVPVGEDALPLQLGGRQQQGRHEARMFGEAFIASKLWEGSNKGGKPRFCRGICVHGIIGLESLGLTRAEDRPVAYLWLGADRRATGDPLRTMVV